MNNHFLNFYSCRFINHFNNIYEFIIFFYFVWSLSTICCTLFLLVTLLVWRVLLIDFCVFINLSSIYLYNSLQSQPNPNPIEILTQSILVTWSFILIFFLCQCGQFVTNQFDDFDDKLYQCNWHLFPIEIQRMLVIVMTNTQRPSTVHGFANTFCTRDAFKGVKFRVTWEEIATIHVLLIFLRAFVDRSGRILLFYDDASN